MTNKVYMTKSASEGEWREYHTLVFKKQNEQGKRTLTTFIMQVIPRSEIEYYHNTEY